MFRCSYTVSRWSLRGMWIVSHLYSSYFLVVLPILRCWADCFLDYFVSSLLSSTCNWATLCCPISFGSVDSTVGIVVSLLIGYGRCRSTDSGGGLIWAVLKLFLGPSGHFSDGERLLESVAGG